MTRIVIADDHPIFRRGLRDMIEEMPGDHAVVGEAEDGAALLQQVRVLRPDVAVVDLAMPRVDGFQFMERLGSAGGGGVAVNPATDRVFITNSASNNVSIVDGDSNAVVATQAGGQFPYGIAVNPTDGAVYVGNGLSDNLSLFYDEGVRRREP